MSTSDAAELERRVVGGETATPQCGTERTTTARKQQDKTCESCKQENHRVDESLTGEQCHPPAIRQLETHQVLTLREGRLRKEEAAHRGDSELQTQKHIRPRFTSCLFFRLSTSPGPDDPELKRNSDPCLHSLTETQRAETVNSSCQIGQTSPPDTFIKETSDSPLSKELQFPAKKKDATFVCNKLETTRDLSINHCCSNGESRQHECNGLHVLQCWSKPKTPLVELEDQTKLGKQTNLEELSIPARTMLSSSMVTVLAPHWNGRLRRTKRLEGNGSPEAQGNLQDVANAAEINAHGHFQETADRLLTEDSQAQLRVPFQGTRSNTVGWSSESGPASLGYESKPKLQQTVSLDVNSGRMNNRKIDASALSPVATTASPMSPLFLDPNEQRKTRQTGPQGGLSSLRSKPTTSSLLLSRRFNSKGRNSNATSTLSEINHSPLSSSPKDEDGKLFTTHRSPTFHSNSEQERSKHLLSPLSTSYRTTETGPILSPSSSNHRERAIFETRFFSASPTNKDMEDAPFTQQPQTINRTQSSLLCSKQDFLSRGPSERQQNCRGSDKSTNLFSENCISSLKHSPYDRSACLLPRRATLTSTSWWKQVTQEGSSPHTLSDTTNTKDKSNTPLVQSNNDSRDLASTNPTDNKRFSPIPNNINNNTTETVCNTNHVMMTQGRTHNFIQRNAEDSLDHEADRLVKKQYGSNLNNREPQKPESLPDLLSSSKISRATAQTTLNHPKDPSRDDISRSSFTVNVTELPPTLQNPKSSNTPTENSSKYNINHCTSPNAKTSSSFSSNPVTSQTNSHASLYTSTSSQTSKFTNTVNATPLGFERSYAMQKPFHSKTASSLSPTINAFSKTNYSSVQSSSSSTTGKHPTATTGPIPSPFSAPVTTAVTAFPTTITSLLTPPATPTITSSNYSDTSSPKGGTFSSSQEGGPKKQRPCVKQKRVRRVTWEDSVDVKHSEPITVEKPEPFQLRASPSPSRSLRGIKAPSIFSFLRSSSPTTNTHPPFSPTAKTSSIQVVKGGKYRSLSSDCADLVSREGEQSKERPTDTMVFDQERRDVGTPRQERTLSVGSGTGQCRSSAPVSLPTDFSSGYKLRYSSPPYSTLMSTRSTQPETKTMAPRSQLFQQPCQSNYAPQLSIHNDLVPAMTMTSSSNPLSPVSPPKALSVPFQNKTDTQESLCGVSETDQVNNNQGKDNSQDLKNGQISLVNNRVQISSQYLQGDKIYNSSPTCVTETLVYSIKSKVETATSPKYITPEPLQHTINTPVSVETKLGQQSCTVQTKEATGEPHSYSDQSSSGSSSKDSQPLEDKRCNRKMEKEKENVLCRSRLFSVESNNEQSPKRSRFALKKSVSTPNSSLSRSESERASKTNNKMDQVLNKLRQTFSTRRSDDDILFPWKWKRASQTPSVSGLSDISNASDNSVDSTKPLEERQLEKGMVPKDSEKGTEDTDRWTQNRYTLIPPSAIASTVAGDKFYIWSEKSTPETNHDEQNACMEHISESQNQPHLTIHSPTTPQFDFYKDNNTDYKPTNQFLSCRDPSPGRSPNPSAAYPAQFRKSSSSPRSPFSPFSSLSPVSTFPSPDVTDDSVFYSPKLQRRRESSSPCEPGEGISLGGSRRSRASTGPPSVGPGQDKECLTSSYADLKYGIEPGRSFSVSSVLSSRPSGPGRISIGSRFMSVGDLSESALTCGSTGRDMDQWSVTPDWPTEYDCQTSKDYLMSDLPRDPGKMRSRSLPRSLTRCLANWSSGVSASPAVTTITSKPARLWSPNMNTCHFAWDTEGPPTPPPTPPLSPVSRRMSQPPSPSSPTFPSSSGAPQQVNSQSPRGHLPSRGYVSSLSTFEESSDSSSDTTTDDEYYLETDEDGEKETEL